MAEQSKASATARRCQQKRFQTLRPSLEKSGGVLKLEPFFLIVAARRVARCLLYSSYTAKFHSGIQTRSSASPSDVSSTRLNQTKSDLGVIIPHFGWQRIKSKCDRSKAPTKTVPNFKTLTGEVRRGLKVGTFFFDRCRASRCQMSSLFKLHS